VRDGCLSFWFDYGADDSRRLMIGDANWNSVVGPTDADSYRASRIEIERSDGRLTIDVLPDDGEGDFRVAELPPGYALVCNVTTDSAPMLSVIVEALITAGWPRAATKTSAE
jgi:hypothetical protein